MCRGRSAKGRPRPTCSGRGLAPSRLYSSVLVIREASLRCEPRCRDPLAAGSAARSAACEPPRGESVLFTQRRAWTEAVSVFLRVEACVVLVGLAAGSAFLSSQALRVRVGEGGGMSR